MGIIVQLQDCLKVDYHIHENFVDVIVQKMWPLIECHDDHVILKNFIEISATTVPGSSGSTALFVLPADDAVVAAPVNHEVFAENERVRILWGSSTVGDQEPLHRHYWKSILVMLDDGTFEVGYADGSSEVSYDKRGVYELPPDTQAATYKNLGGRCRFVRFEIK